jgi:phosphoglycerol transferase
VRVAVYVAAALIATGVAWFAFGLSTIDWRIPLDYHGDALAVASHVKTVIETGWYEYQPALGAPFGQVYFDYPVSDNLHFVVAKVLALFSHDVGVVLNISFLLGFPAAALAMVWFLERLSIPPLLTITFAVLFAVAPYHFWRGEGHLFLAAYFVVPPALWFVYATMRGIPLFTARATGPRFLRWATGTTVFAGIALVLLGSASSYYSVFTVLLLGAAGLGALILRRWRSLVHAVIAAGVLVVVVLLNMLPDYLYRLQNGANVEAMLRTPVESELYSFKLAQLLLPAPGHVFEPFRYLREQYDLHYPLASEGPALGLVGAVGLIAVFVVIALLLVRAARGLRNDAALWAPLTALSLPVLVAFLFGTVGGLSTLVSFVTTSVRAWNRLSILILGLTLAVVAILVAQLLARLSGRRLTVVTTVVAVGILSVGIWDQVPVRDADRQAAEASAFASDAALVAKLEDALPDGSSILQLPYIPFPESEPVNGVLDTEQLRPFLHSTTLRWSAGGIKGRPDITSIQDAASVPPADLTASATDLGYAGILLDTKAMGVDASGVEQVLQLEHGEPITSDDGRFVVYLF